MQELPFAGSRVLLTGASRGIGRELALTLARPGVRLALVARDVNALQQVSREVKDLGGEAWPIAADLGKRESAAWVVSQAQKSMDRLDCLINVAGVQPPIGPFWENDLTAWEHTIRVNLLGPVHLIQAALPAMLARRQGKIINFSGGGGTAPRPHFSAYATSKAALVRFTENLAMELKSYNIQVNIVAPGAINTYMLDEIIAAGDRAGAEYQPARERAKSGGAPVKLVCSLILFLVSPASGNLTGKLISAPHDPWQEWSGKADDLNASPLYTIRRMDPFTLKPLMRRLP